MVGDRIRKLRTQQKLSQKELARKLDVSVATSRTGKTIAQIPVWKTSGHFPASSM